SPSRIRHPEPSGSRSATPALLFQHSAGQSPSRHCCALSREILADQPPDHCTELAQPFFVRRHAASPCPGGRRAFPLAPRLVLCRYAQRSPEQTERFAGLGGCFRRRAVAGAWPVGIVEYGPEPQCFYHFTCRCWTT